MLSADTHCGNLDGSGAESSGRSLDNFYRTYDPATGRYLEADPLGQLSTLNLYQYAFSNPTNYFDPTGLESVLQRLWRYPVFRAGGDFAAEAYIGYLDLERNRRELVDSQLGDADKYFHCKGHCEACKEGPGGELLSEVSSASLGGHPRPAIEGRLKSGHRGGRPGR